MTAVRNSQQNMCDFQNLHLTCLYVKVCISKLFLTMVTRHSSSSVSFLHRFRKYSILFQMIFLMSESQKPFSPNNSQE